MMNVSVWRNKDNFSRETLYFTSNDAHQFLEHLIVGNEYFLLATLVVNLSLVQVFILII